LWVSLFVIFAVACGWTDRLVSNSTQVSALATPTRTPWPTFTPTTEVDIASLIPTVTDTPTPQPPTETPPPAPSPTEAPPEATPTPDLPKASVTSDTVNIRSGPGTGYGRIGQVSLGDTGDVIGRNNAADWILINYAGGEGWIATRLTQITGDVNSVEVVQVDPPPPAPVAAAPAPAPAPAPAAPAEQPAPAPAPASSSYAFKISNIFGQTNGAITQIRGYVKDRNGQPMNGVRIQVRSGSFCTVSYPSGAPGNYPNGNYDILLRPYASDGQWQVAVVDKPTNPEDNTCDPGATLLSEEVSVPTNTVEGVTYVEYQQN
jgi:hypothetical protein